MVQLTMIPSAAAALAAVVLMAQQPGAQAAAAINLGDCADFALMAGTSLSFNGASSTVVKGSVGVSPGTSISGLYTLNEGSTEDNTAAAISCASSMLTAYNSAKGTTCTNTTAPVDLSGLTLVAGVYCNAAGYYQINSGSLTLSGSASDVWIFQAATSVTTGSATSIILSGGAVASNVFWQVGTTLSTGTSSSFTGTILAGTSITLGTSSTLAGQALAQAAMACTSGNTITSNEAGLSDAPSQTPTVSPSLVPGTSLRPSANPSFAPSGPTNAPTSSAAGSSLSGSKMAMISVMSLLGLFGVMSTI